MSEVKKAPWFQPSHVKNSLHMNNSLTQSPVPFHTQVGNVVKWYGCGPTVYDSAHLGHARAYVTFDIMRRILSDYFNYDVFYVMNITDVDDKIILRARRNYLVAEYKKKATDIQKVIADSRDAFLYAIKSQTASVEDFVEKLKTVEKRYQADMEDQLKQAQLKLDLVNKENSQFEEVVVRVAELGDRAISEVFDKAKGALAAKLDKEDGGASVDHSIFKAHTQYYEQEFLEDLANLNVREVDALTRVTEYIPNIITFVEQIIANGYAYESKGSVYFDTIAFANAKDTDGSCLHHYAKLKPTAVGNLELASEGEGSLGTTGEKRHQNDFALWKNSRPGEPRWDSPWGLGRPGWHIECSAMATDLLGTQFDVHSGGDDLKFPHHDNEIAQSEAYSGCQQWINYFFHAGHLNIAGLKMSKSLKNFVTIRDVLAVNTARQIRLLFLLQKWDGTMNYNDDSLKEAVTKEHIIKEFFMTVNIVSRAAAPVHAVNQYWSAEDRTLQTHFEAAQAGIHSSLCDNMNYPAAMTHIMDLISHTNKYLAAAEASNTVPKTLLVKRIAAHIERLMRVFGVIRDTEANFLDQYSQEGSSSEFAEKVIDAFSTFRDSIREAARVGGDNLKGTIMKICDQVRDDDLPVLGIRLEDKPTGKAQWKLDDPAELLKQREEKKLQAKQKQVNKLTTQLKNLNKNLDKYTLASTPPSDMFSKTEYSQFNEQGLPTHDEDGAELSKNKVKQVTKEFNQRTKDHTDLQTLATKAEVSVQDYLSNLKKEVDELTVSLNALNLE